MTEETRVCPRCRPGNMQRRYSRPGVYKDWWTVGTWLVCLDCKLPQEYTAFRGEVTPQIKMQVLGGEVEDVMKDMSRILQQFREVGLELGVWTPELEANALKVEADIKASLGGFIPSG